MHSLHLYTLTGLLNFFIFLVHQKKNQGLLYPDSVLIAKIIQWMFEHGICSWSW
jgi:hypothetical protein